MTVHEEYRVRRMGGRIYSQDPKLKKADIISAIDTLWPGGGPFQVKGPSADGFGEAQVKGDVADVLTARVPNTGFGRRWLVRKEGVEDRRLVVVKKAVIDEPSDGDIVLQEGLNQLGDDYNWADAGPDRFDCSGLVVFCHREVDITLPHSTYTMWHYTPSILHFTDRAKLKNGDIVFCDASDRPSPNHCGLADADNMMIVDASTSYDMVVHRRIDSNPVVGFGRILAVNGVLG